MPLCCHCSFQHRSGILRHHCVAAITEAAALEPMLKEMGLKVPAKEIDGTAPDSSGRCLSDALVSVGPAGRGGTGSFISSSEIGRAHV